MNKQEMIKKEMTKKANRLLARLNFDECVTLYNSVEKGNPMIDLIFDRMDSLDEKRFDEFLG